MIMIDFNRNGAIAVVETEDPDNLAGMVAAAVDAIDEEIAKEPRRASSKEAKASLPLYRSHKKVRAAKIMDISAEEDGSAMLLLELPDGTHVTKRTRKGWVDRFDAGRDEGTMGIYVEYEDGFSSWSPTDAFENGYERID